MVGISHAHGCLRTSHQAEPKAAKATRAARIWSDLVGLTTKIGEFGAILVGGDWNMFIFPHIGNNHSN